ncbi:hypothetical protein TIFTF001_022549 [Ficus carica]|uniref:Pre-mRNA-splicing factor SLU7 n=1 Tax=Ficus carica TaxID=3494 RepID=A0AA88AM57_FICCA|nr:hypothetical protein TIFTF001_022549 [Ficus carica]
MLGLRYVSSIMATALVAFKSREDHRKHELEEACNAGLAPAEVDDDGKEINPHIPQYMSSAPWYLNLERSSLKHQRKWKSDPNYTKSWYDRGAKNFKLDGVGSVSDDDDEDEDALKVDEAKIGRSKQMDFAKVEKRVRTTGGGSTGTVRNLRIREDIAKYLLNLDVNSAYYDPKTQSMREDPLPADPNENVGNPQDNHLQAAPSQAELLYKNYKVIKEKLKSQLKDTITKKHGNAASGEELPRELLLGQSEREVEYDRAGRVIKGLWKDHQWGYKCCQQTIRNIYCTGSAGIEAVEAAANLMKANIARKAASEDTPAQTEEKNLATWGTDVPDDLVLDQKKLDEALKKEDERKREHKDERKRKYNVSWNDEVTAEEKEAYRMNKIHHDYSMKYVLH